MDNSARQKKADKLLQEVNRKLRPHCEVCGKPTQVGHHYFPRSVSNRLRYDLKNIVALCNGCHFSHHNGNPAIQNTINFRRGVKWLEELEQAKKEMVKVDKAFYESATEKLSTLLLDSPD